MFKFGYMYISMYNLFEVGKIIKKANYIYKISNRSPKPTRQTLS